MTDHRPTPPPWWAVHPEPDCRPVILVSQREYKEIKRKKREEQEAAQLAARHKAKSKASMERRARRKGAVPRQLSPRGQGRPPITSMEARRLAQKVTKMIYTKDCGRGAAYRHIAESERRRIAQDPESARQRRYSKDSAKRHVRVLQNETDLDFRRAFLDDPLLAPWLDGDFQSGKLRWLHEQASLKRQLADAADDQERMTLMHWHQLLRGDHWYLPFWALLRTAPANAN
jgi:hypothetical protein